MISRGNTGGGEKGAKKSSVIDSKNKALQAESIEGIRGGEDDLFLGEHTRFTQNVDIALHKLPIAPLLWALRPPHRSGVEGAKNAGKLAVVAGIKPGQWDGEVIAKAKVPQALH